jgi:hypothetical protein
MTKTISGAAGFLVASLFFFPPIFSQEPRWAILYVFGAVALIYIRRIPVEALLGLPFLAWAALSLSWSPDPGEGFIGVTSILVLGALFVVIRKMRHDHFPVIASLAILGALALTSIFPGLYGGFGNQNWITEFVLLLSPFVLIWRWGLIPLAAAAFYLSWVNNSYTELPVLFVLLVVIAVRWRWWAGVLLAAPAVVWIGWFPDALGPDLFSSLTSRAEVTINSVHLWLESPIWGHGLGSFNYDYARFQESHLGLLSGTALFPVTVYVGAAHNEVLQCLVELGLVGVGLFGLFALGLIRLPDTPVQWAASASLLIGATLSLFAFPLQNPATAFVLITAMAILSASRSPSVLSGFYQWSGLRSRLTGS